MRRAPAARLTRGAARGHRGRGCIPDVAGPRRPSSRRSRSRGPRRPARKRATTTRPRRRSCTSSSRTRPTPRSPRTHREREGGARTGDAAARRRRRSAREGGDGLAREWPTWRVTSRTGGGCRRRSLGREAEGRGRQSSSGKGAGPGRRGHRPRGADEGRARRRRPSDPRAQGGGDSRSRRRRAKECCRRKGQARPRRAATGERP